MTLQRLQDQMQRRYDAMLRAQSMADHAIAAGEFNRARALAAVSRRHGARLEWLRDRAATVADLDFTN